MFFAFILYISVNQVYRTLQLLYRVIPSFILYISVTKIRSIELYNCYTGLQGYTLIYSLHFSNQNQIYRTLQLLYRVIPSFILYISVTKSGLQNFTIVIQLGLYPHLSIYKFGLSVCLFVCLYPINVKTAEPIGPNFFVGHLGTLGKVYENSKFQIFVSIKIRSSLNF